MAEEEDVEEEVLEWPEKQPWKKVGGGWFVVLMVLIQCEHGLMIGVHSANLLLLNVCCVCFEKIVVLCGVVELMFLAVNNHLNCIVYVCVLCMHVCYACMCGRAGAACI